jgi:hypothetical protein
MIIFLFLQEQRKDIIIIIIIITHTHTYIYMREDARGSEREQSSAPKGPVKLESAPEQQ